MADQGATPGMRWRLAHRFHPDAVALADRHYSRQQPGTPQMMPAGRALVLLTECGRAVWGTSWPQYVKHAYPDTWCCSIFRNEGAGLSSDLIREAISATRWHWPTPPAGMITFVDDAKTSGRRSRHGAPGQCFIHAGFEIVGITPTRYRFVLHLPPERMPEAAPPRGAHIGDTDAPHRRGVAFYQ